MKSQQWQQKHENEPKMIRHAQLIATMPNFSTAFRFTYLSTALQCFIKETIACTFGTLRPISSSPPNVSR
jgi:hypothetical protein